MLKETVDHLLNNVVPAAKDYESAEDELTRAFEKDADPNRWAEEGRRAKRRAAEVAIAIDGLADRAGLALKLAPDDVRNLVSNQCIIDGALRSGSIERVCAVANAYKHAGPLRAKHPINSDGDILAAGAGYGIDGYGVGKFGGVEVLVNQRDGYVKKFMGDVPWSIAGWFRFLATGGALLPAHDYVVCGLRVHIAGVAAAPGSGP